MLTALPPVRFTGAQILRDGALQRRSLALADGRITKGPLPEVDMRGYLLLPGIIDLHGVAFERVVAPSSGTASDIRRCLDLTECEAASHGVTTAWLALSWSWEGGIRGPDFAERFLAVHAACRDRTGTDLRVQIRSETHMIDTANRLLAAIRRHAVDYVIFKNHLGRAVEALRAGPATVADGAFRDAQRFERRKAELQVLLAREKEVPRHLCRLADAFDTLGVRFGSHADPDGETRETFSMIGASIAEFPTTRRAAAAAKAMNDPVILSAQNVLHGGPRPGCVRATDLIAQKLCDALASEDDYSSLARAAWNLIDRRLCDLPRAWSMISEAPADILRLHDRGRLDFGRRADVVAVNAETRAIEMTISGGVLTHLSHEAARRFAVVPRIVALAAE
ncbi:alpha-D-ribose 1-methylphosphonate 5-triphosphate diphosphatase [Tropicimonas sp. IMCC6043]|uniref:alpha-D-ribose 1-methylphosphonate 5-triphosphate diphosphatase n=1 Tax=Tropicimonas sp. IMCC6043 TaxID=2510645 RepID=UPI00101B78AE|nr:alpha-D-ribose 1-methylphosphonate 5-triphosphate diphosphatase [Tropicimonas sp. IMCC6043]RYH11128.1 alpha-D-ribose 1-methylphosphonate 5-triphosphate diphosphatase [Tropicimonas sp. IMCC6043]